MVSSVPKTIGIYKIEYQCVYTMAIYIEHMHSIYWHRNTPYH